MRSPRGAILIDAGLSPRTTDRRLAEVGLSLDQIAGVCVTHLDRDHLSANFLTWLSRRNIPLFCHQDKVDRLHQLAQRQTIVLKNVQPFGEVRFEPLDGLQIEPIPVAHDAEGSHAFILEMKEQRIGFATDLGRVPTYLIDRFCDRNGLDVLAIESNYCPELQMNSPRPAFLKHRIMGGHGHLSNQQAYDAVRSTMNRLQTAGYALPGNIVLLHRSQQCNCPIRLRNLFSRDARISKRLTLAEQNTSTGWLMRHQWRAKQMTFAWG